MNILLLAKKNPWPPKDGEAVAIMQMARGMAAQGHHITVLYMNTPKHHFDAAAIPKQDFDSISFEAVDVNASIKKSTAFNNLFKKTPYHVERFFSEQYLQKIKELHAAQHFNIIQAEGLYLLQYFSFIPKKNNTKFIYRSHNLEYVIWKNVAEQSKHPLKKWYLNLQSKKLLAYENSILNIADAVVPISKSDAQFYKEKIREDHVFYSPAGIDINRIPPESAEKTQGIYFLGALDWMPNTEGLMWFIKNIFPSVNKTFPDLQFHIAGRNAPAWMQKFDHPNISFHGEIDDAQTFIQDKFICIVPLLSGSGMKLKIIEAMSAGKYVITTAKGAEGMPEGLEQHIAVATTAQDFIKKLSSLLQNKSETVLKAHQAQNFVFTSLNNRIISQQLIQFYSQL